MYWGSRYCAGCKHNRNCYMMNSNPYGYGSNRNDCYILEKMFQKEYEKENSKKGDYEEILKNKYGEE